MLVYRYAFYIEKYKYLIYILEDDPTFEFSDEVVMREKAIRVSGKLGGVAGVLHGVI